MDLRKGFVGGVLQSVVGSAIWALLGLIAGCVFLTAFFHALDLRGWIAIGSYLGLVLVLSSSGLIAILALRGKRTADLELSLLRSAAQSAFDGAAADADADQPRVSLSSRTEDDASAGYGYFRVRVENHTGKTAEIRAVLTDVIPEVPGLPLPLPIQITHAIGAPSEHVASEDSCLFDVLRMLEDTSEVILLLGTTVQIQAKKQPYQMSITAYCGDASDKKTFSLDPIPRRAKFEHSG
jgi:hypothetical protein